MIDLPFVVVLSFVRDALGARWTSLKPREAEPLKSSEPRAIFDGAERSTAVKLRAPSPLLPAPGNVRAGAGACAALRITLEMGPAGSAASKGFAARAGASSPL